MIPLAGLYLATCLALTPIESHEIAGLDGMLQAIFDASRQRGFDLNHDRHVGAADLTVLILYNAL